MGSLQPLRREVFPLVSRSTDTVAALTDAQREHAYRLEAALMPGIVKVRCGELSIRKAADWLAKTRKQELQVSAVSVARYLSDYLSGGLVTLAPQYKGRVRKQEAWEPYALYYRRLPSQLSYATIAETLRDEHGFANATAGRVQNYLQSLPEHECDFHPSRVGPHFRRQNLTAHKIRDRSVVPVGLIYQGDGHSLHYYVRHPNSGHHITAELTPWMDIGSRYITGWFLGYSESAVQSLYSLSAALLKHDHVMAMLHVDPGSGFKNKLMCDEVAGFAPRVGAEYMTALPGNARGKGDIEGWFRWFEEKHGKLQPSYKGKEVPQEFLRRLEKRIESGEMYIPVWEEALDGIARYITRYNERNQDNLGKRSPASLWEGLQRSPLHIPPEMLVRPREIRVARSFDVALFNRVYRAPALKAYEGRQIQVEYDLTSDKEVSIYDIEGRFITHAIKVKETPWLSQSRLEDLQRNQEQAALKRLENKAELVRANNRAPITADATLEGLEAFGAIELPAPKKEAEGLQPLDLLDTDY